MQKLRNHWIGVDQGDLVLFSDFQHGGEMWTGEGPRMIAQGVTFGESFKAPPTVTLSISMWDVAHGANVRADIRAEDVARDGFTIVFRTWGDTRVARLRVAWMAIGELRDADEWELG
ncbi:hypothetical protein OG2516_08953 [Oceanicola granulosus HTCC2516]|uniref:H-type lectin domain-containing protein n=1 Tax=Oceanicola granulosus (strain ATCC BAA-861 / DSM 15982 / KCTC 12143 / HTCC2516) TaxID=314256 RepID=Q2CCQ9_OCEGH|nr:H-type lectin domain-containing protein [Oceanicola granulosus]EAR50454.1 hypothetical protein OG2516_08953 [Oceanicola granulosus HTCC2516]